MPLDVKDKEYLSILLNAERSRYEWASKRASYPEFKAQYQERIDYIDQLLGKLS